MILKNYLTQITAYSTISKKASDEKDVIETLDRILKAGNLFDLAPKSSSFAQSICTHYSCFENMGWFETLKKMGSKI